MPERPKACWLSPSSAIHAHAHPCGGVPACLPACPAAGVGDVLHTAGLTRRELRVLRERGWDAYQRLVRQRAAKAKKEHSTWRRGSGKQQDLPVQLEAVVVQGEPGTGTPPQQELPLGTGKGEEAAEWPAVAVGAAAGAAEAAGRMEAGAAAPTPLTTEERDGVLHTTQMNCRTKCGQRLHTICSLMPKRGAGSADAMLPAAPEEDAPPTAQQPQAVQLQAVAEERDEESPPSTPRSPAQHRSRKGQHWWQRPWKSLVRASWCWCCQQCCQRWTCSPCL